jgi:hypothetical protein
VIDFAVLLTPILALIGLAYCVVRVVEDVRVKRYGFAAWGMVATLALIEFVTLFWMITGFSSRW